MMKKYLTYKKKYLDLKAGYKKSSERTRTDYKPGEIRYIQGHDALREILEKGWDEGTTFVDIIQSIVDGTRVDQEIKYFCEGFQKYLEDDLKETDLDELIKILNNKNITIGTYRLQGHLGDEPEKKVSIDYLLSFWSDDDYLDFKEELKEYEELKASESIERLAVLEAPVIERAHTYP